jgi:hypothetical protein
MLRDRIARAESHWHAGMPGRHAVLAMLAFGLEETADYARAETLGRLSVELEPRDGWGWHAVAHVMEMQNRRRDGIDWLTRTHRPGARAASLPATTGGTWRCSTWDWSRSTRRWRCWTSACWAAPRRWCWT